MLVPAGHLVCGQRSEVDATLAGPSVAFTFTSGFAAPEMHFAASGLSTVLGDAEERREVPDEFVLVDAKVVVEQVEKLLLHQVDLGLRKESAVARPMLVLRGRVVEVLCGNDEGSKENTVPRAVHALGDAW